MKTTFRAIEELMKTRGFWVAFIVWMVIYVSGVLIYMFGCQAGALASFYNAFKLFTFSVNPSLGGAGHSCGNIIYIIGFVAAFYTSWGVLALLFKRFLAVKAIEDRIGGDYILVFGLGDKASAYIDSELQAGNDNIVAIEHDLANLNIDKYRSKGVAVKIADARDIDTLRSLNLVNVKHMVAMTGNNSDNLEIALALKSVLTDAKIPHKDLYMRIDDGSLSKLYKNGSILDDNANLVIHMFSMAQNSARELFVNHDIDGKSREYIDSDKPFGIVVAGASGLGVEVVGQICELAHLPNQNRVTIYCVDDDADALRERIELRYPGIEMIPNISLEYISLDKDTREFYTDEVWHEELTHVVLAYGDSKDNLSVATGLADSTYIKNIWNLDLKPRIHIAIYEERMMAREIDANQGNFGYFDTFACTEKMASRDMILDEKLSWIAKCIHSGYAEKYILDTTFGDQDQIEEKWLNMDNINNRPSNIAQAYHIKIKLKALGLTTKKSDKNPNNELISYNRDILNAKISKELKALGIDDDAMLERTKDYTKQNREVDWEKVAEFDYFPTTYQSLVEKLIRSEHDRWNAYHYLRGWKHITTKTNKPTKEHRCLTPMPDMDERDRFTVLYDLYSILYIPNLLASVGHELMEADPYHLQHHLAIQDHYFDTAIQELEIGKREGDWMGCIFPLVGADEGENDESCFALKVDEVRPYCNDVLLGARLKQAFSLVTDESQVFDDIDKKHFKASRDLFKRVEDAK